MGKPKASKGVRLYLGNIPKEVNGKGLRGFLESAIKNEEISGFYRPKYKEHKTHQYKFKTFAYLTVKKDDLAQKVLKLNGKDLGGKAIKIDKATPRPSPRVLKRKPVKGKGKPRKPKPQQGKPGEGKAKPQAKKPEGKADASKKPAQKPQDKKAPSQQSAKKPAK